MPFVVLLMSSLAHADSFLSTSLAGIAGGGHNILLHALQALGNIPVSPESESTVVYVTVMYSPVHAQW